MELPMMESEHVLGSIRSGVDGMMSGYGYAGNEVDVGLLFAEMV